MSLPPVPNQTSSVEWQNSNFCIFPLDVTKTWGQEGQSCPSCCSRKVPAELEQGRWYSSMQKMSSCWFSIKVPVKIWLCPVLPAPEHACLGLVTWIQDSQIHSLQNTVLLQLLPSLFWLIEISEASSTSLLLQRRQRLATEPSST